MKSRRWLLLVLAGIACALLLGRGLAQIYTDHLWYSAMGAVEVWRDKYVSLTLLRLLCGVTATAFVFVNLYAVRQSVVSLVLPRRIGNLDIGEEVPRRQLTWTAAALSALIGIALSWPQNDWSQLLAARIGRPFGESDPYFAADVSFFVYQLPFELSMFRWALTVALIVIGLVILLYALTPSLRWEQGGLYVSGYVRRHLAMLAGILLLLLAWHYRLEMFTVLSEKRFGGDMFGYVDHRVGIPASLLLALITLGAGLTVLWGGWTGQMRLVFAALTGVIVAALAARQVAPFVATRLVAEQDMMIRERPYEATRAGYTRRAFAVDRIRFGDSLVTFATLGDAAPHIPIWDEGALRRASDRSLPGASVGWTESDSGITALLPTRGGSGALAIFLAASTEDNGMPLRWFGAESRVNVPPVNVVPDSGGRTIILADSLGQLAAPALNSSLARLAHALSLRDVRIWMGALPAPAPKLMSHRTVRERVRFLAPFFSQGSVVTPIWFGGSLSWSLELYSASSTYPLSRHVIVVGGERAYFQHAATALVDAHTGRVTLVADSMPDPIAASWIERFPRLFVRPASLPMAVRRQLPPPRESARAQASAFGRFGSRGESDVERHLPPDEGPDSALAPTAAPLFMFPRAGATGLVLPMVDGGDRIRGLFIALGGPSPRSVWLPLDSAPMWNRTLDRLRAADTMPGQTVVRGFVRAIPVGNEVVLAQPRYEWRPGAPRLLYVNAFMADSVRSAPTLLELAGRPASPRSGGDFRARVTELYEAMMRASERGDFEAFGRALDELGALLARSRERESP